MGRKWILAGLLLSVTGCASMARPKETAGPPAEPVALSSDLSDAEGKVLARVTVTQVGGDLRLGLEATGLAPGAYGAHLHETGRCDPPGFTTAGAHWNPSGRSHGKDNPLGMHKGDLPNLLVGTDGRGSFEVTIAGAATEGAGHALLDRDGASALIHALPDDYRTDPSGNSGARIACGILD